MLWIPRILDRVSYTTCAIKSCLKTRSLEETQLDMVQNVRGYISFKYRALLWSHVALKV